MKNTNLTRIAVDIGGTFTDIALDPGDPQRLHTAKTLTTPDDPVRGVIDVIRIACRDADCAPESVDSVIHGTTLATNALIERRGAKTALITTEGFRDVIEMRTESRFEQYDLNLRLPDPLLPRHQRYTVSERVSAQGDVLLALHETICD